MAKKMGRPRVDIDRDQFEKLCGLQCTKEEIAGFFDCSEDTIDRWCKRTYGQSFAVVFRQKRQLGCISLRRTQWKMSEHNVTMAIWLGKQYLGQSDKQEVAVIENDDDTIYEMDNYFANRKKNSK